MGGNSEIDRANLPPQAAIAMGRSPNPGPTPAAPAGTWGAPRQNAENPPASGGICFGNMLLERESSQTGKPNVIGIYNPPTGTEQSVNPAGIRGYGDGTTQDPTLTPHEIPRLEYYKSVPSTEVVGESCTRMLPPAGDLLQTQHAPSSFGPKDNFRRSAPGPTSSFGPIETSSNRRPSPEMHVARRNPRTQAVPSTVPNVDHRGQPMWPGEIRGHSEVGPRPASSHVETPIKQELRGHVDQLRQELIQHDLHARQVFYNEKSGYEAAAREVEQMAEDATSVRLAKAEIQAKRLIASEVNQKQKALDHAHNLLQKTSQEAQAALHTQHTTMVNEAQSTLAQNVQALELEANQAFEIRNAESQNTIVQLQQQNQAAENHIHAQNSAYEQLRSEVMQSQIAHQQTQQLSIDNDRLRSELMQSQLATQHVQDMSQQHQGSMIQQFNDSDAQMQNMLSQLQSENSNLHSALLQNQSLHQETVQKHEQHMIGQKALMDQQLQTLHEKQVEREGKHAKQIEEMQQQMVELQTQFLNTTQSRVGPEQFVVSQQNSPEQSVVTQQVRGRQLTSSERAPRPRSSTPHFAETEPEFSYYGEDDDQDDDDEGGFDKDEEDEEDDGNEKAPDPPPPLQGAENARPPKRSPVKTVENADVDIQKQEYRVKEAESITFDDQPTQRNKRSWRIKVRKKIAAASGQPDRVFHWWKKAMTAKSLEELQDSEGLGSLDAKIAIGLFEKAHGEFRREIELQEEKLDLEDKMLNGRQMYWLFDQELRRDKAQDSVTEVGDLFVVSLQGDNLRGFQTSWDRVLLYLDENAREACKEPILQELYYKQIEKSKQFEPTFSLHQLEISQNKAVKSYKVLYDMVNNFLETKRKQRNRDKESEHGGGNGWGNAGSETSDQRNSRPEPVQVKFQKGDCKAFFNKGKCPNRETCPWDHTRTKFPNGKGKGKGNGKGKKSQEQRGRSANQEGSREITSKTRGTSPSGEANKGVCTYFRQGRCTRDKCNMWHPPKCHFFKNGDCKLGNKCCFIHGAPKAAAPASDAEPPPPLSKKAIAKAKAKAKADELANAAVPLDR